MLMGAHQNHGILTHPSDDEISPKDGMEEL